MEYLEQQLRLLCNGEYRDNVKEKMEQEILSEHFAQLDGMQQLCENSQAALAEQLSKEEKIKADHTSQLEAKDAEISAMKEAFQSLTVKHEACQRALKQTTSMLADQGESKEVTDLKERVTKEQVENLDYR